MNFDMMATRNFDSPSVIPEGSNTHRRGFFHVNLWRRIQSKLPTPFFNVKILNFEFEQKKLKGLDMVERATGWNRATGKPVEWDSEGICRERLTAQRLPQFDLFVDLFKEEEHHGQN